MSNTKINFDAARYCRNNAGRMGKWMEGEDIAGMISDEIDTLRAELSALKEAARPVAAVQEHYASRLANWQDDINAVLKQRDDIHARAVRFEKALETIANGYIRQPICPHMDGTIEYGNHLMNRAMMIGLAIATLRGEE